MRLPHDFNPPPRRPKPDPGPGHTVQVLHASLFDTGADALVNPVNCRGVLGAGLARAFKARFPAAYADSYAAACRDGRLRPGSLAAWRDPGTPTTVISLATKDHWRDPSRLEWIDAGLVRLPGGSPRNGRHTSRCPRSAAASAASGWPTSAP